MGPITSCEFLEERYFFTFIDRATKETKTYIEKKKTSGLDIYRVIILEYR